jgi:C4-type Zn-finger protein
MNCPVCGKKIDTTQANILYVDEKKIEVEFNCDNCYNGKEREFTIIFLNKE